MIPTTNAYAAKEHACLSDLAVATLVDPKAPASDKAAAKARLMTVPLDHDKVLMGINTLTAEEQRTFRSLLKRVLGQ